MLSIVPRGHMYQVRYASSNPYGMDRTLGQYAHEEGLTAFLHHWGVDTWSITQAVVALRKGEVAVLPIVWPETQQPVGFLSDEAAGDAYNDTHDILLLG